MEPRGTSNIKLNYVHGYTGGSCGYCHNENGSITCGLAANHLSLRDYTDAMDRGWRRCGDYYYKPDVINGCCKLFTIRLDVTRYQMRKSHKKVLKKWNRFLAGEDVKPHANESEQNNKDNKEKIDHPGHQDLENNPKAKTELKDLKKEEPQSEEEVQLLKALRDFLDFLKVNKSRLSQALGWSEEDILQIGEKTEKELKVMKGNAKKFGAYTTNLLLLLFADNRVRLGQGGIKNVSGFVGKVKDLVLEGLTPFVGNMQVNVQENGYLGFGKNEKLSEGVEKPKAGEIGTITKPADSAMEEEKNEKKKNKKEGKEKRMSIEEAKTTDLKHPHHEIVRKDLTAKVVEEETSGLKSKKFEIRFEKARFEQESFDMYKRYYKDIHEKEEKDRKGYENFLCMQALEIDRMESQGKVLQLGCYHMKYYIDGKLIAIGVVDLLPKCLSSVYFFYEPEYKYLSLGVVGAIKEIEYVQEMREYFPEFKYYYLGYYVQDCQKMVYKGDYEPAELLCPHTYTWVTMDEELRKRIDKRETKLSGKNATLMEDMDFSNTNLEKFVKDKVKLDINGPVKLIQLNKKYQDHFIKAFKDLATGLGRRLVTSFVFSASN